MRSAALAQPLQAVETLLPLTNNESRRLRECEQVIERGINIFYEVGNALAEIRESGLYRIQHATFELYCRQRWSMSRFYAHRLIDAAQVVENLLPIGNVPASESQTRELASFEADVQKAIWHIALNTAPTDSEGKPKVTANHIRSVVNVLTEVVKGGGMDDGSGEIKPLGQLIDAAVTEETYERMMRQKQYIRTFDEKGEKGADQTRVKREPNVLRFMPDEVDTSVLSKEARQFLDDYMLELAQWTDKLPKGISNDERQVLEQLISEHGNDALRLKKRTRRGDCEAIVKVMKDTEAASHSGEMAAADLYDWMENLRYFMSEVEFQSCLDYMTRENVRMALLTDAGEGKQDDRRGKLPGIVCVPWRKIWHQRDKRPRDEEE